MHKMWFRPLWIRDLLKKNCKIGHSGSIDQTKNGSVRILHGWYGVLGDPFGLYHFATDISYVEQTIFFKLDHVGSQPFIYVAH